MQQAIRAVNSGQEPGVASASEVLSGEFREWVLFLFFYVIITGLINWVCGFLWFVFLLHVSRG